MAGYRGKYLKTYLWSGLAMVLNFASMFIVAPLTTSMPEAYGVYSLCISFNIFIRYADLGFITAGRKYAAEAFANNDKVKENKYVGTSMFIYGAMVLVIFLLALFGAAFPEYLIKNIGESPYYGMSHQLLVILAFSFLFSIIYQFCSLIYTIRIEDYKIQRVQIVGSALKILSVPVYFFNKRYDIVGYYLFCETLNVLIYTYLLYNSKNIGYGLKTFLKCLRFDKSIFREIMPLALSGFASVIGWVTYFELDTVGISILLGANAVAIYAVGKQIQNFIRSLTGILFTPYRVRINYFIGQNDFVGLQNFYYMLTTLFSFIIIPIITIVLFAKPFIIAWVGNQYEESYLIMQLLVLTYILHFITSQGSSVIYGLNKVKDILKIAFVQPILFWIGVFATYKELGVESFAVFQLAACLIVEFFYCHLVCKYLEYKKSDFYLNLLVKPLTFLTSICFVFWYLASPLLDNVTKGHKDFLYVVFIMGLCCLFAIIVDYCINKTLRNEINNLVKVFVKKNK